jgi:hypothetical protein
MKKINNLACSFGQVVKTTSRWFRSTVFAGTAVFDQLKVWAQDLDRRFGLKGCTLKVWKARGLTGNCATYSSTPDREIVIGA